MAANAQVAGSGTAQGKVSVNSLASAWLSNTAVGLKSSKARPKPVAPVNAPLPPVTLQSMLNWPPRLRMSASTQLPMRSPKKLDARPLLRVNSNLPVKVCVTAFN